jgi:hypothetical protein
MSFVNPFFYPDIKDYKRDFDVLRHYRETVANHISKLKDWDYAESLKLVNVMMNRMFPVKSPEMHVLKRKIRHDRNKAKLDFLTYINWIAENKHILTPNLICYANPELEVSFIAGFINENLALRKSVKKAGQRAEMEGNKEYADFCNLLQANYKIRNNSISGATSSAHNPLYYTSAHTALTSFCRAMTSTANSINERMLASNRHYYTPDIALANISYITYNADLELIASAMANHGIAAPSKEYVIRMTLDNCHKYWRSESQDARIIKVINSLSPYELAAFAYCNDLHGLQETNPKFLFKFYSDLLMFPTNGVDNTDELLGSCDDDLKVLVGTLCSSFMRGKTWDDVKKEMPDIYRRVGARILHVQKVFTHYADVIKAFYTTNIMPQNLHQLPGMVRAAVVASDTDSSIFSCQRQVYWFTGSYKTDDLSIPLTGITTYIVSQNIAHNLALLCAQIGVEEKQLFRPTMKTEYQFNVFAVTPKTKHYMATMEVKEGNVYAKTKYEIKGVNLKNSKLPPEVREILEGYQKGILNLVKDNADLSPHMIFAVTAYVEHRIKEELRSNSAVWYKAQQIKTEVAYANKSVFRFVPFWNEVFGPKYGYIEQVPVPCIEVPVDLDKPAKVNEWIESLPGDMIARAKKAVNDPVYGFKTGITRIMVPMELIVDKKLPVEIHNVIAERKILAAMMAPFYLTMMTCGLYVLDDKLNVLASDLFTKEEAEKHLWLDIKL